MSNDPSKSIKSNRSGRQAARQLAKANAPTEPIVLAQHTPGPWTYSDDGLGFSVHHIHDDAKGRVVAKTRERFDGDEANARLIAAAPEMLDALRDILPAAEWELESLRDQESDESEKAARILAKNIAKARAAISRATGGAL